MTMDEFLASGGNQVNENSPNAQMPQMNMQGVPPNFQNTGQQQMQGGFPNQQIPMNGQGNFQGGVQNQNIQGGFQNQQIQQGYPNQAGTQVGFPNNMNQVAQQQFQAQSFEQPQFIQGNEEQKKKGGALKFIFLGIILLFVVVAIFVVIKKKQQSVPNETESVDTSWQGVVNTFVSCLNDYNAENLDSIVGSSSGDSYIAQEWAYVNGVILREEYIKKICSLVSVSYITDNEGAVLLTIPDYSKIAEDMADSRCKANILRLFKASGYAPTDYLWQDEMNNLFCQFMLEVDDKKGYGEIPTTNVEVAIPLALSNGTPIVTDDSEVDKLLFSSPDFHKCLTNFSKACLEYTGYRDEEYVTKEEQHNPEYDEWYALFKQYYDADGGHFDKNTSKWEPWYLRDNDNNIILDENGNQIVNYYSVKREDGTDWIQPDETIKVDVVKTRMVDDPWVDETGCTFTFLGTYYIQNEYIGNNDTTFRVGDGSLNNPAGIGTTIITKAMGTDGNWHDVKVALLGYWTGQDAIDYAEMFDKRNRGFTATSVISLITYEMSVENLEEAPIEIVSGMALSDKNSNLSSRTGTMYGFTETQVIQPHEKVIINDWATSTELDQKYVVWGKGFDKMYSLVFFNVLAGTGDIPEYSAYKYFTGKSAIDESVDTTQDVTIEDSDEETSEEALE